MTQSDDDVMLAWQQIADDIEQALHGLSDAALDARPDPQGWSIREFTHHIVESNLVASNIILAALAKRGAVYDWSWVMPNLAWAQRMGYRKLPVPSALAALRAWTAYFSQVIRASDEGTSGDVQLLDSPGAALYTRTVRGVLEQEIDHAAGHLREIAQIRVALGV